MGPSSRPDPRPLRSPGNGIAPAVPSKGVSKFPAGGSAAETGNCGCSETWLAQRTRAVIFPSVISFSPLGKLTLLEVQKILSPSRYER